MGWRFHVARLAIGLAGGVACAGRSERTSGESSGARAGAAAGSSATAGSSGRGGAAGGGGRIVIGGGVGGAAQACARGFEPIENSVCGNEICVPLPDIDPRFAYAQCCTADGHCGSGWEAIFGKACFHGLPARPSDECPTESIFVYYDALSDHALADEFPGCCLPDGRCGLDTSASMGAGCVERSLLSDAARSACTAQNFEIQFQPLSCTP